jgi:hemoglobin
MAQQGMSPTIEGDDGQRGDLDDRSAIHDLVVAFYREVVFDELLAPVFTEVAEVDWSEHIPKLIDFWCRVLLGEPGYRGAVLAAHLRIHDLEPLRIEHFDRWHSLWVDTIDARWRGPIANLAKDHAARIGASLAHRLFDTASEPVTFLSRPTLPLNEWTPR